MKLDSKRSVRKCTALLAAIALTLLLHEGTHALYALAIGTFQSIRWLGVGMQVVSDTGRMTAAQLGIFCLLGPVVTVVIGWVMVALTRSFTALNSLWLRAFTYFLTLVLLVNDPLYLSVLYPFVDGGDMNGIALLVPETAARIVFAAVGVLNLCLFFKRVYPAYKAAYRA